MLTTIRILKPSFVVGENVAGLVSMENGKTLDTILSDLENEGYTTEQVIIPACAVGAWHRRDRIWIIAYNNNTGDRTSRSRINADRKAQVEQREQSQFKSCGYSKDVSNSNNQRQQTGGECGVTSRQEWIARSGYEGASQWLSEPSVGRVANGIPNRVDRLKGLGNAIVPQVALELFKAIEQMYNEMLNN